MNQSESNNYALDNLLSELSLIKDLETRNFTTDVILHAPGLYWYRPSAFFRGHHPEDELGVWGNLIHVKRVLIIAKEFVGMEDLDVPSADALYSGLTMHDIGKYGINGTEERIQKNHPDLVAQILQRNRANPITLIELIMGIVVTHMGRWGNIKPATQLEKIGGYCDCIASRTSVVIPIKLK